MKRHQKCLKWIRNLSAKISWPDDCNPHPPPPLAPPSVRPFCVERKKVKCEIKIRDECQELWEESFHLGCRLMKQPLGLTCYLKSCISSGTKITPQCFNLLRCWMLFKNSQEPPHSPTSPRQLSPPSPPSPDLLRLPGGPTCRVLAEVSMYGIP